MSSALGGIFADYDSDWPSVFDWTVEDRYQQLIAHANERVAQLAPQAHHAHQWSKDEHLFHIQESGLLRYAREIFFHYREYVSQAFAGKS
jgi:hypothetical protein